MKKITASLCGLMILTASSNALSVVITYTDEAAFLAALGGSTDSIMDFEDLSSPSVTQHSTLSTLYYVNNSDTYTQDGISLNQTSLIIDESYAQGQYNIGNDDTNNHVGHLNPSTSSLTATVSHASNSIYASGLTYFTVKDNATHAPGAVSFDIDGQIFDTVTSSITGNLLTAGSSQFFGFISDTAVSSYDIVTTGYGSGPNDRRFLIVDDIYVNSSAVPEPSILALMGLGIAGLAFSTRRRKDS